MKQALIRGLLLGLWAILPLTGGALLFAENERGSPRSWPDALEQYIGPPGLQEC